MSDTILLTGGTGFLGMELIARLLEADEGPDIVLLVRAADRRGAAERVQELLARLYERPPAAARRLRAIRAELTAPGLGLGATDRREVLGCADRVVHCAASISFTLPLAQARAINVGGTRGVLDLARELPLLERFVHVSTAYVAGRGSGRFTEDELDRGQSFRNTYEQTKLEAECVLRAAQDLPTVVVRPSIVIGESDSGWTSAFNVVYWPLQAFARGLLGEVPADPAGIVDMVPVDHVTDVLAHATLAPDATGTLHAVGGDRSLRVSELIELASTAFGRPAPRLVAPDHGDDAGPGGAFASYFDVQVAFDDARAQALGIGPAAAPAEFLPAMLDYAKAARWGKRPLTRQAARERVLTAHAGPPPGSSAANGRGSRSQSDTASTGAGLAK